MDKEDCIVELLCTLQKPSWKSSSSVTDWDLKSILWKAGLLLTPEQTAGLLADVKRRGLISAYERRGENGALYLWGVRITPAGEDWLRQAVRTDNHAHSTPLRKDGAALSEVGGPFIQSVEQSHPVEVIPSSY